MAKIVGIKGMICLEIMKDGIVVVSINEYDDKEETSETETTNKVDPSDLPF